MYDGAEKLLTSVWIKHGHNARVNFEQDLVLIDCPHSSDGSRSLFTFTGLKKKKKKKKSCATNNTGRKEQYIPHSPLNHRHRQSTEVF